MDVLACTHTYRYISICKIYIDNERSGEKEGDDVTNILAMVATEVKRGFDGLFDDKEKNI